MRAVRICEKIRTGGELLAQEQGTRLTCDEDGQAQ